MAWAATPISLSCSAIRKMNTAELVARVLGFLQCSDIRQVLRPSRGRLRGEQILPRKETA